MMQNKIFNTKPIIIAGVRKCGTTSLFHMVSSHKNIAKPPIKENQFFSLEENIIERNFRHYQELYEIKGEEYFIDSSTFYFSTKNTPILLKKYLNMPKILIIIRDPAKRTYSAYLHMKSKIPQTERRSFNYIINNIDNNNYSLSEIINSERNLLNKAIKNNEIEENYLGRKYLSPIYGTTFNSLFYDKLIPYRYFENSIYSLSLENYYKTFSKEDIKVIIFEKLIKNPRETIDDIFDFLGLSRNNEDINFHYENKTYIPKKFISKLFSLNGSILINELSRKMRNQLGYKKIRFIKKIFYDNKPQLSYEQYMKMRKILKKEYEYWLTEYNELNKLWRY
jgi:hypothetical protein